MQLMVSAGFELAHDEAYYWLYSQNLDWGYFDHPPFVGWVIRLFSIIDGEFGVRFGFILLQFLGLGILLKLIALKDHLTATLLFFAFPLASVSGLLALPDMPLLFMSIVYCWALKRGLENRSVGNSLLLAVVIALLLFAKYHGVLLLFFTLVAIPRLLKDPYFYLTACVSLLLFSPHLWWQYQHDFATLRYHFLERPSSSFSLGRSLEYVGIQILFAGVLAGPVVWWDVFRKKTSSEFDRAMKFVALGTIIFFFISSFSKKVEANWTVFIAPSLIYLTAGASYWQNKVIHKLLYASFSLVILARLILVVEPETFGIKRQREFHGWKSWSLELSKRCSGSLLANNYQIASKLSFYLRTAVPALNFHSRKNQFDLWRFDQNLKDPVCYVTDKEEFTGESIQTPEGKSLKFVTNKTIEELRSLKEK